MDSGNNKKRKILIASLIGLGLAVLFFMLGDPGIFTPPSGGNNNDSGGKPAEAVPQNGDSTNQSSPSVSNENSTNVTQEEPVLIPSENSSSTTDNTQVDNSSSQDNNQSASSTVSTQDNNQSASSTVSTNNTTASPPSNDNVVSTGGRSHHSSSHGGSGSGGGSAPQNHLPLAENKTITVFENAQDAPIALNASDADGELLSYLLVSQTNHGAISGTAPSLTYTPDDGYLGVDSFKFRVNDGKGNSNTATINILVKSPYNYDPSFVATGSNYQDVTSDPSLQLSNFTVAAWFKNSEDYHHRAFIVNKGGFGIDRPDRNLNYGLWLNSDERLRGGFESASGQNIIEGTKVFKDNEWHYGVLTYDGDEMRLYVDGKMVSSIQPASQPESTNTKPVRIAANSHDLNGFFIGNIDEVRIWNRAITATEVAAQFSSNTFDETGQVLYLPFN